MSDKEDKSAQVLTENAISAIVAYFKSMETPLKPIKNPQKSKRSALFKYICSSCALF